MKFKLFFGLMLFFTSFATLSAQSYVAPQVALDRIETAQSHLENGVITATLPQAQGTTNVLSAQPTTFSQEAANSAYSRLLGIVAFEIAEVKDTAQGITNALASPKIATTNPQRMQILAVMMSDVQSLLSN